ncbi:hypothetical protein L7F22_028780 [Adiantum nelumboides]|nr:hypothetical protein [Adiantum nelumboides]
MDRKEEMALLRKQMEETQRALSHPEVQQLLHTLDKGKEKQGLESGEFPQDSARKEPEIVEQSQREAQVGPSQKREKQNEDNQRPDSPQFSFMKHLDDIVPEQDMKLEPKREGAKNGEVQSKRKISDEDKYKKRIPVDDKSKSIHKKKHKKKTTFKAGDKDVKFEAYNGRRNNDKALAFIRQFEVAFAEGNFNERSKLRHVSMYLKGTASSWYSGGGANELDTSSHLLTLATRELFNELDTSHRAVAPVRFWTVLRGKYPQFAQQTNTGMYMQQDAEECWTQLLYTLSQRLGVTDDDRPDDVTEEVSSSQGKQTHEVGDAKPKVFGLAATSSSVSASWAKEHMPEPVRVQTQVMHTANSMETPVRLLESMQTLKPMPVVQGQEVSTICSEQKSTSPPSLSASSTPPQSPQSLNFSSIELQQAPVLQAPPIQAPVQTAMEELTSVLAKVNIKFPTFKGLSTEDADDHARRTPAPSLKELFSIELASRISCSESGEEATEKERVYSLKCHISQDVNHLLDGLKLAMKSELEKVSPALQRSCVYIKQTQISDLPLYTTVQFVRFFWKRESNQKAKILRRVEYPVLLDVFDLCSEELQEKLKAPRQILRAEDDAKAGLGKSKEIDGPGASSAAADCAGSCQTPAHPKVTGYYDLVAVLTHKGRSADSGHYVAWVKQESGKWIQFDDHQPIPQKEEDITRLSGGGDWHMAYILLYKARVVTC